MDRHEAEKFAQELKFLLQGMYGPSGQMSLERYKCKMLGTTTTRKRRKSMTKG